MKKLAELYSKLFNFWMQFPEKIRFLLVGGYNTVFAYILYVFFLWISGEKYPQTALFLSFILSSFNSFISQKIFVFNTRGNYKNEYIKCMISWGISYFINVLLLQLFTKTFEINAYAAQAISLTLVTINSFILLKYFAFNKIKKG